MTQRLFCSPYDWLVHLWHWYKFKQLVSDERSEALHLSMLQLISSHTWPIFILLVWKTPEIDASETALIEQSGLTRFANLQALPELVNCGIYRSEWEYFIFLSVCCPPRSVTLCLSVCFSHVYFESYQRSRQFLASCYSCGEICTQQAGILLNEAETEKDQRP